MSWHEHSREKANDGVRLCLFKRFLTTFPLSSEFYGMKVVDKTALCGIIRRSFNTSSWTGLPQTFALRESHVSELHMN